MGRVTHASPVEDGVSTFPTSPGLQLPFVVKAKASTVKVAGVAGQEYAYYYDSGVLYRWELSYPVLTSAEVDTLRSFFDGVGGGWDSFTFTDPDTSVAHTKCRFDGDFELTLNSDETFSLRFNIQEFR